MFWNNKTKEEKAEKAEKAEVLPKPVVKYRIVKAYDPMSDVWCFNVQIRLIDGHHCTMASKITLEEAENTVANLIKADSQDCIVKEYT